MNENNIQVVAFVWNAAASELWMSDFSSLPQLLLFWLGKVTLIFGERERESALLSSYNLKFRFKSWISIKHVV